MATVATPPRDASADALTPYVIEFEVKGTRDFIFNAGTVDQFDQPGTKRERIANERDLERKIWRTPTGGLALPSRQFIKALISSARGMKDPLSARRTIVNWHP